MEAGKGEGDRYSAKEMGKMQEMCHNLQPAARYFGGSGSVFFRAGIPAAGNVPLLKGVPGQSRKGGLALENTITFSGDIIPFI